MRLSSSSKIWAWAIACLVMVQTVASVFLPKSFLLTAITDWISFLLMVSAALAFGKNAIGSEGRQRIVWVLLSAGYSIEAGGQMVWMYWELVRKEMPALSLGDACVYLAWTALILGFALRPHVEPTKQQRRLGTLDLLILLLAGIYLYLFLVVPWQYLSPEPLTYGAAYKYLALAQDVILLSIVALGWQYSAGLWRKFYGLLTVVVLFDTVMEYVVDTIADAGVYFSGGWYDTTTAVCLAAMTAAAFLTQGLEPVAGEGDPDSDRYWRRASHLAAPVTLILPILAAWSFLDSTLPLSVWKFRVVLSLIAVVVFGFVGLVKQMRLESELADANRDLLDASLTDALTGVRNRRFFTTTIEADVQQVQRLFANPVATDVRNRDLVFYLIDVDHFKDVNDEFGHQIGDKVLIEVASRINSAARLSDAVIRWGGEEFLLISRRTDRKDAHILAKRVLDAVGSQPYRLEGIGADIPVTCSVGWAAFPWIEAEFKSAAHEQVLMLADYALYQAKGTGRNRAVGLLPPGDTVRDSAAAATIYINGMPTSPVTTLGPSQDLAAAAAASK